MKVVLATGVALSIASLTAALSSCGSKPPATAVYPSQPMTLEQKQQVVENSNMSAQAKQSEEQAAARAASQAAQIQR